MTTHTEAEIASQPSCWRRAVANVPADALPREGERVAVVGCGTSWFIAMAYAVLRERAGQGETDAFAASEFPAGRAYDRVLALSRSGTTTEVLELLSRTTTKTTAITADPDTPIMTAADELIVLDYADERSVVQTRFATTQLALLRAGLGEDLTQAIADAEQAVSAPLPGELVDAEQFSFLGTGWSVGLAQEAALKMREASRSWTEAYPAMEYRHGPISIAAPGRVTWMLGTAPEGLRAQVEETGGTFFETGLDPMAELIRAQRVAVARAFARGLDPDEPMHLTRSVILSS
ncbi:Fructoselysine-6-P-deglycase FrlB with duplicated sugar isomerase (SIS) domain [Nonomuraea solani]|uniref:Fructoselysine-6-P-deglycase FrlB with duplicated sugar isomerase (SIS) domain n=1 Tax=Nonomuraea solani TaxID=1144553 RepID=A0A1H6EP77_9ACTN|nr:SIS domain-containing protein [Nonomuraea solani]SEG99637.1 Fructoselysine-6-P-deglycase FrlB with duplicated sugar isomerase (SIS) domain [Nonomuraea solani]